jgi:hypothetical protein
MIVNLFTVLFLAAEIPNLPFSSVANPKSKLIRGLTT